MIDPKAITSYAQYNEDVILLALLHDVKKGFYVDVGANYPVIDSVTKLFYDRGWRGINIEPIESLYKQINKDRPNDINLHLGVGDTDQVKTFREYIDAPGHSTFNSELQKQNKKGSAKYKDYDVHIKPLAEIFKEHKVAHIDFLKIDVEGYEHQVIAGNDWQKYRPEVICIEADTKPDKDWQGLLVKNGYQIFISDQLNEYYVAKEAHKRTDGFAERVVKLDYHALKQHQWQSWSADSAELARHVEIVKNQDAQLKGLAVQAAQLQADVNKLSALSLANQTLPRRIKRAVIGLTADWLKYKKNLRR